MNYKILSTGSKGNCVVINDVMIDCGLPYNKLKAELYDIKYLIITHTHSDHMKIETLTKIAANFPHIRLIGNFEVHNLFAMNYIANAGFEIETEHYTFYPFELVHDVLCYGYCWSYEGKEIIYATDTATLENAPKRVYDYLFLESNHDEEKLEKIRGQKHGGYDPYLSGKRHLSTQQAKAFFYMNRRSRDSEFIELHMSSRFY
jgi:ribonuclease BN (tRNA processing enzyme)